jgi:hypothetical protein
MARRPSAKKEGFEVCKTCSARTKTACQEAGRCLGKAKRPKPKEDAS